jgi:hypothetical protein
LLRQALILYSSAYQSKNGINIYVSLFRFTLIYRRLAKYKVVSHYNIKFRVVSRLLFNSSLIKLISKLRAYGCGFKIKFNWTKSSQHYYTVLRSPSVYKKSQEQFYIRKLSGNLLIYIGETRGFSLKYLDFFLSETVSQIKFDVGISIKRGFSLK